MNAVYVIVARRYFFCGSFLLFVFRVCHVFCLFVVAWERADLLALSCVMLCCDFGCPGSGVMLDCINF